MTKKQGWKSESKTVAKRVLIGVLTAIATSAAIYFLGFNRPKKKADSLEVKKNTIQVWKDFIKLENGVQPKHDTLFARVSRKELTMPEHRRLDSLVAINFVNEIKKLQEVPDIDNDMRFLLRDRVNFKEEELNRFIVYSKRFVVLSDTLANDAYKNFMLSELNTQFVGARDNAVERLGRSMEDMLQFLQKRHKYAFQLNDLIWYERYLQLKSIRQAEVKPDVELPEM